jgi:hypothetical protein
MSPQTNLEKLQRLLRDMFQFDCADLDFGIYRIMNYKRDVIERFITRALPEAISEEFSRGALAGRKLTDGADEVFVNGDSFIPKARALEPVFKNRMFAPVEA